ncbi:MAG TPA: response regulator transcription factor [Chloroflexia bacterium]|nr:response regulator transcription factor [Chloroflexia bacterium]
MTRVFLAAPTPMMRAGLRAMLEMGGIQVIGEASSPADISHVDGADVLVVGDEQMVVDVVETLGEQGETAILVLSDTDAPASLLRALPLRGWGIVSPDAPSAELQAAVSSVAQGLVVLSLPLAGRLLDGPTAVHALDNSPLDEPLTAREAEVLDLLSQGLSNKLIARKLQISEHTVKFHVSSIYTKLGAASRTDAVSKGARHGLISF